MLKLSLALPAALHRNLQHSLNASWKAADRVQQHHICTGPRPASSCCFQGCRGHNHRERPYAHCRSFTNEGWLAFKPDHDNRGMDEAENGALVEARNAKRPRPDDVDTQSLNGVPQLAAAIPAGKAPAVHTKALRSVLKGNAQVRL